jgi:hypothetical protein
VIAGAAVSLPVYLVLLHLLAPTLLPQLRRMAFPARASQDPHPGEFESAIAAHDVDAMVRPASISSRQTG